MTDYIKRDDALNVLCDMCEDNWICDEADKQECQFHSKFMDIPAADVVEVVRCRDCKYCNFLLGKSPLCLGGAAWKPIKESDYCAWGERRTENG